MCPSYCQSDADTLIFMCMYSGRCATITVVPLFFLFWMSSIPRSLILVNYVFFHCISNPMFARNGPHARFQLCSHADRFLCRLCGSWRHHVFLNILPLFHSSCAYMPHIINHGCHWPLLGVNASKSLPIENITFTTITNTTTTTTTNTYVAPC